MGHVGVGSREQRAESKEQKVSVQSGSRICRDVSTDADTDIGRRAIKTTKATTAVQRATFGRHKQDQQSPERMRGHCLFIQHCPGNSPGPGPALKKSQSRFPKLLIEIKLGR